MRPAMGGGGPAGGGPAGGAAPGLAGPGARETVYLCMPNDRVFFMTNFPEEKVKELLASDGATPKVSAETVTLVRRFDKDTLWFACPILDEWKGLINMAAGMNPKMTRDEKARVKAVNELKWIGGAVNAPGDLEVTLSFAFATDTMATQQAQEGLREWTKYKPMVLKMAPLMGPFAGAATEIANSLAVKQAWNIALVSFKLSKTTVEGIKGAL